MNGEKLRDVHGLNNIKLPPQIKLSPVKDSKFNINIKNNFEGGIGKVQIFVNAKEIIADARNLQSLSDSEKSEQALVSLDNKTTNKKDLLSLQNLASFNIEINLNKYQRYFLQGNKCKSI